MELLSETIHIVIDVLHILVLIIMIVGVVASLRSFIISHFSRLTNRGFNHRVEIVKKRLGMYILYALEILIVVDILESILDPKLDSLLRIGIIVIIRTALSFFLEKEISHIKDDDDDDIIVIKK